ncbi:MAG TPA: hypothetical protein VHC47_01415 [Mucilaginibacter sp.]|nr:hypothetical protein [Mucilaginibacter sp.]
MKTKNQKKSAKPGKQPSAYPLQSEPDNVEETTTPSYSEEHDVNRPVEHEFPSFGNAETDFVRAERYGRRTHRLLDHEPGL